VDRLPKCSLEDRLQIHNSLGITTTLTLAIDKAANILQCVGYVTMNKTRYLQVCVYLYMYITNPNITEQRSVLALGDHGDGCGGVAAGTCRAARRLGGRRDQSAR